MQKVNTIIRKPHVLVAVLNWGLGHATRCMPIINQLLSKGIPTTLASDGQAYELLKIEYPNLPILKLPSYNIHYKGVSLLFSMIAQVPKIKMAIQKENHQLNIFLRKHDVDLIISDNRYGIYHPAVKSILISHQLHLIIPNRLVSTIANRLIKRIIKPFDEIWVPDFSGKENLTGDLSHLHMKSNVRYIGPLSRMKKLDIPDQYEVIAVLSGPEPQRTKLEDILLNALKRFEGKSLLVQGLPADKVIEELRGPVKLVSHMLANDLNTAICASKLVICRPGYSSIMDLFALQQKAILIPTPGQPEQIYLAKQLNEKGIFYSQDQKNFDLREAMRRSKQYKGFVNWKEGSQLLKQAVEYTLTSITH